jgi:hypothetical protein
MWRLLFYLKGENMEFRIFELLINVPFLKKNRRFYFDDSTGDVYAECEKQRAQYPLRPALAGYLYLLATEKKYMKFVENVTE